VTRVLIDITGGVVQWINADGPVDVQIIDDASEVDCECDQKQVRKVYDEDTYFYRIPTDIIDSKVLDPYFKAAKEIENALRP